MARESGTIAEKPELQVAALKESSRTSFSIKEFVTRNSIDEDDVFLLEEAVENLKKGEYA